MNDKQIKSAIRQFRAADLSAIKDEKLRAKAQKLQAKQGGFTLLELLVVITLIAVLATGALVAYEGVTNNASAATESNNLATLDGAIRNYRALTTEYPDQWDSLVINTAATPAVANLATETQAIIAGLNIAGVTPAAEIRAALENVGIEELQYATALPAGVAPNLAHNEGANPGNAPQFETVDTNANAADDVGFISILPMGATCNIAGGTVGTWATAIDGTTVYTDAQVQQMQSIINDELGETGNGLGCNLVAAFGFGHDAAHSTTDSSVAIAQAPTFTSAAINPANNYARYIGLFLIGSDGANGGTVDDVIDVAEIRNQAKLIGVISPEGRMIDQALQVANQAN